MKRYVLLDLIRVIAISLLLIAHIGQTLRHPIGGFFGIQGLYYVSFGGLAVTIFLILSGMGLELQHSYQANYFQFIIKRILRIYPAYYLCLPFGIILYFVKTIYCNNMTFSSFISQFGFDDIFLNITGFHAFFGKWGGVFLGTSWFIGLIMSMYVIYPLISLWLRKRPIFVLSVTFVISVLSRIVLGKFQLLSGRPIDWFPLCRIFEFSLGIMLANAIDDKYLCVLDNITSSIKKLIQLISELSFPLYLIHVPLLFVINILLKKSFSTTLSILCFISISSIISYIVMSIDDQVPREKLMRRLMVHERMDLR